MITSQKLRSATAAILSLGITLGTSAPLVLAAPASAQQRISQFDSIRIPAGSVIPVSYEKNKIVVTTDETSPLTLTVARDIRTAQGRVLIPAGSQIVGELRPVKRGNQRGSQFVASELIVSRRQRYRIDGYSGIITRTEKVQKGAGTGSVAQGAALGAAAAAALAGITGDKAIATEEVLGGAGIGALAGVLLGRRSVDVIVIRPEQDLAVRLRSDIVLR
ncbi:hypothetical protein IQ269_10070 [Tychonema sp. LEGE 07199]|uniref:hypothetical protein n=1 Tax=unclassified Tychonema TaxID=2642144 RepID=UPI0018821E31|nr:MULTISPECIES: hypothetical protein [unclassified Tychonema]MBE9121155.1 hypothetical protein [Tychonema sp. LEGE 07199]MBE9133332.1 hypothetical protein [Tychonema sp. LEGE 07196]